MVNSVVQIQVTSTVFLVSRTGTLRRVGTEDVLTEVGFYKGLDLLLLSFSFS